MIERLELHRWRSFEKVGLNFDEGTTWLVAPNGVGKTSLLLGLAWGLFGDHSSVDAATCVRLGHEDAETRVTVGLGEGRRLLIHRTVSRSGKPTIAYSEGDKSVSISTAERWLTEAFGAPLEIAARIAVIRGSGAGDGELQLREHLYDAFGITGLRTAAAHAGKLHKQAESARKKLRSASRSDLANREQLRDLAATLEAELEELKAKRRPLAAALASAIQMRQAWAEWQAHDAKLAVRATEMNDFLVEATARGLAATGLTELDDELTTSLQTISEGIAQVQRLLAEAEAQAFAARSAMKLLEGHDPSCPTCARPFHGDELGQALAAQAASLTLARERLETAQQQRDALISELDTLADMQRRLATLNATLLAPSTPRPDGEADALIEAANDALRVHDEESGSIAARLAAAMGELDSDEAIQAAYAAEREAWKREALTRAAAQSLAGTAERLATEYIEPISEQVRWRWKALFGEDGLQLRPDGSIVRVVGDRELPWNQLSSGE
ncbi:MAG: hypothetical protein JWR83_2132, partial [Aeromicrobium sp.]|nr:hypothetical protein [Aeromicrobium sp.]